MRNEDKIIRGYSKAKVYKHLRNRKGLRALEPMVKYFEKRITELERQYAEHIAPKKRGRPKGSKNKGKDNE